MTAECMSWDWREQPDLDELDRLVANMSVGMRQGEMLRIHAAVTDCDEHGIVITDEELTPAQVNERWHTWWATDR